MNLADFRRTVDLYRSRFAHMSPGRIEPARKPGSGLEIYRHVAWMLEQMRAYDGNPADWPKMNRWLGFIQGVCFAERVFTIEEMRGHNRSKVEV